MALRITRPYKGIQKIIDRVEIERDGKMETIEKPLALSSKQGYSPREVSKLVEKEIEGEKTAVREYVVIAAEKTFEVEDEEYVLKRHGAILERV